MSPDDYQEAHDYTPTGTGATTRYVARYGGFALQTSFRSFAGCRYQEGKKFKRYIVSAISTLVHSKKLNLLSSFWCPLSLELKNGNSLPCVLQAKLRLNYFNVLVLK